MTTRENWRALVAAACMSAALLVPMLFAGCDGGGGDNDNDDGSTPQNPNPPAINLTQQIDRMGRAGINTAATAPFFRETVEAEQELHDEISDAYNAASDPSQWDDLFADEIAANIAILDSLDTVCGNQLLAAEPASSDRYAALAGVLADDQLYVNTSSGTCQQYLAVEGNAVGIPNTDCGGRTPLYDTIDVTYSVLAIGELTGVDDGVPIDADGTASITTFPYLDSPN